MAALVPASVLAAVPAGQRLDIPAQPVRSALNMFAAQSGYRVLFPDVPGTLRQSPAISNAMSLEAALRALLRGTGLRIVSRKNHVIVLGPADGTAPIPPPVHRSPRPDSVKSPPLASPPVALTEDIVVTAQRRNQSFKDVPATLVEKSAADLRDMGILTTADLPRVVSGLVFTYTGSWAQPNLRGISTSVTGPGSDNPIAIYLDGVYQGNQVGSTFDLPDVDRIEVLKGPQGTLFGRNATGGAIQVFTRQPSSEPTGSITATAGLFDGGGASRAAADRSIQGFLSGPVSKDVAVSVAGIYAHSGGYFDDIATGKSYGTIRRQLLRAKLLYEPSGVLSFTLTGYYAHRSDQTAQAVAPFHALSVATLYPGAILPDKPWQLAFDYPPSLLVSTWGTSLLAKLDTGIGTLTSLTAYVDMRNHERADVDGAYAPACLAARACIDYDVRVPERDVSHEVIFSSSQLGRFKFVAGGNLFMASGTEPTIVNDFSGGVALVPGLTSDGPAFQSDIKVKTRAYAIFADVDDRLTSKLSLTVGARISIERKTGYGGYTCCDASLLPRFVKTKWTNVTPRVAVAYDISHQTSAYATLSRGFKSGVIPYSNFSAPAIDPETITAYEIGLKTKGAARSFNAAAFLYDYHNLQAQITQVFTPILNNAASARIWGLDLDGSLRLSPTLRLSGALSFLPEAKFLRYPDAIAFGAPVGPDGLTMYRSDDSGKRMFKTPKITASAAISYRASPRGTDQLSANLSGYYSSSFYYEPSYVLHTGAFTTLDARVAYRPSRSRLEYALFGRNLTNKAHINQVIPSQIANGVNYAAPRELGMSANYSF